MIHGIARINPVKICFLSYKLIRSLTDHSLKRERRGGGVRWGDGAVTSEKERLSHGQNICVYVNQNTIDNALILFE